MATTNKTERTTIIKGIVTILLVKQVPQHKVLKRGCDDLYPDLRWRREFNEVGESGSLAGRWESNYLISASHGNINNHQSECI